MPVIVAPEADHTVPVPVRLIAPDVLELTVPFTDILEQIAVLSLSISVPPVDTDILLKVLLSPNVKLEPDEIVGTMLLSILFPPPIIVCVPCF